MSYAALELKGHCDGLCVMCNAASSCYAAPLATPTNVDSRSLPQLNDRGGMFNTSSINFNQLTPEQIDANMWDTRMLYIDVLDTGNDQLDGGDGNDFLMGQVRTDLVYASLCGSCVLFINV